MRPLDRALRAAGLSITIAAGCTTAADSVPSDARRFAFRAERVPVGRVLHYTKSNIDGTRAIHVAVYVADTSRLEMVELEPDSRAGVLVSMQLDWATFSASRIESWQLAPGQPRDLRVRAALTDDGRFVAEVGDARDTVVVGQYPVHLYNLGLVSLAALFPHLRDPEGAFRLGLIRPTYGEAPGLVRFAGTATVRFAGEVPCHAALCRRYEIAGPGIGGTRGTIWVQLETGVVENIEIPLPTHPDWRDFKLELHGGESLTPAAWATWVAESVKAL